MYFTLSMDWGKQFRYLNSFPSSFRNSTYLHLPQYLVNTIIYKTSTMNSDRLHGLTAVVTGSSSGLGRGIALALAAAGARLVVCADLKETQDVRSSMDPSVKASKGADMASRALEVANKSSEDDADTPTHEFIRSQYGEDRAFYVRCDISLEQDDVDNDIYSTGYAIQEAVNRTGRLDLFVALFFFYLNVHCPKIEELMTMVIKTELSIMPERESWIFQCMI
jgi:hypothetical protein